MVRSCDCTIASCALGSGIEFVQLQFWSWDCSSEQIRHRGIQYRCGSLLCIFRSRLPRCYLGLVNFKIQSSTAIKIPQDLDQLQRNRTKKQFIETSLKSLVQVWVTFLLPTIIIYSNNNTKRSSGTRLLFRRPILRFQKVNIYFKKKLE